MKYIPIVFLLLIGCAPLAIRGGNNLMDYEKRGVSAVPADVIAEEVVDVSERSWWRVGAYSASVIYDVETTLACQTCPEGNPLMPDTKNRIALYGAATAWTVAIILVAERSKHKKLIYTGMTILRLFVGTMNLRYAGH